MNYHFAGDVIAGAFLGGVVGTYAAHFAKVAIALREMPAENREGGIQ